MIDRGDPDHPGRPVAERTQCLERGVDLLKVRCHCPEQALAGLGRRDTSRGTGQEPDAEPRFEPAKRVAQGRWRHAEPGGRPREAPFLRNRAEGDQIVDLVAQHL